jgi:hypothetical protein
MIRPTTAALLALVVSSCAFDWSGLDPREGGSSSSSGGGEGGSTSSSSSQGGSSSSSGGGGSSSTGAGGGGDDDCLIPLQDDFAILDSQLWAPFATTGCDASSLISELVLDCGAGSATRQAGIASVADYDLTGCGVAIEVTQHNFDSGLNYLVTATAGPDDHVLMGVNAGSLTVEVRVGGVDDKTTVTLDATAHRWLRMQDDGRGCVTFTASPDGLDWNTLADACTGAAWSAVGLVISMTLYDQTAPIQVGFDNLNLPPAN